ncbi:hypothetical protein FKM82_025067 [Ascaphus truei]
MAFPLVEGEFVVQHQLCIISCCILSAHSHWSLYLYRTGQLPSTARTASPNRPRESGLRAAMTDHRHVPAERRAQGGQDWGAGGERRLHRSKVPPAAESRRRLWIWHVIIASSPWRQCDSQRRPAASALGTVYTAGHLY